MRIINTTNPPSDSRAQLALYSGMDVLSLFEINAQLDNLLTAKTRQVYNFEMSLQTPLLAMEFEGILVDTGERKRLIDEYEAELREIQPLLHQLCEAAGYYEWNLDYYLQGVAASLPPHLPRSWEEWKALPLKERREIKATNPEACAKYHWALHTFGLPYNPGAEHNAAFNGESPKQKLRLFYGFFGHCDNSVFQDFYPGATPLFNKTRGINEVKSRNSKGEFTPSTNRDSLEKIIERGDNASEKDAAYWARPFASCCLEIVDLTKALGFLRCKLENGYFRTSFGVTTETGRLASKDNAQGYGSNSQNVSPRLRTIFTAEPEYKFAAFDYEQIESRIVGAICYQLFGATAYLNSCCSGDLHTLVCSMVWPDLGWPSDFTLDYLEKYGPFPKDVLESAKKLVTEGTFYRDFNRRDVAKRLGHGCLTEDHEVLTPSGWVFINNKPPIIMQYPGKFVQVEHWADAEYSGNFIQWEGQSISVTMTTNHRVYYAVDSKSGLHVKQAIHVPVSGRILLGDSFIGGHIDEPSARLLAAYHCDGNYSGFNQIRFHFHKIRKINRLLDLVRQAGITYTISQDNTRISLNWKPQLHAPDWTMLQWNKASLTAYMDELVNWDGWTDRIHTSLFSTKREWLEMWQTFNRLLGKGGNIQKSLISGFGSTTYKLLVNNRTLADRASFTIDNLTLGSARVYCPTVESGAFYIRRNGKISVTGNSSYMGKPPHMAKMTHIPLPLVQHFQQAFFSAFPEIPQWHRWVQEQLQTKGEMTTMLGRVRKFFARPTEDATLREAIAYEPQSVCADYTNQALLRIYQAQANGLPIKLFLQKHDEIAFKFAEKDASFVIPTVRQLMEQHLTIIAPCSARRDWFVPVEAKVGWNLGYRQEYKDGIKLEVPINPNGLVNYPDSRIRQEAETVSFLQRRIG